jgi:tRNA(Leu) C34 or U34 (ribose-2'-O)-methylase TrmL
MKRGYFGIGIYRPKTETNIGTLWRSAHNFGADFIFTIGFRYKKQGSDTTDASKHIPLYEYKTFEDFKNNLPIKCHLVFIEQTEGSRDIKNMIHPENAIYILGAEDDGIPEDIMIGHQKVFIDTPMCLNVAVAGSIVMFDRKNKL